MKKILAMILALALVLSLAACSNGQNNNANTDTNTGNVDSNTGSTDENTGSTDENTGSENDANTENNETPEDSEPDAPVEPEDNTDAGEGEADSNVGGEKLDAATADLLTILQKLYEGYNEELPMLGEMPLEDAETFQYFAFAQYVEGAEAMVSEPMMGSIAHSFVLVRLPEGTDAAAFAAEMEANADPRKWICVEAEKVAVASYENLALLCMSNEVLVDTAIANFNSMFN